MHLPVRAVSGVAELLVYGFKRTEKWTDGFVERWTDEQMDGHADRWKKFFWVQIIFS